MNFCELNKKMNDSQCNEANLDEERYSIKPADVVGWVIGRGKEHPTRWNNVEEITRGDAAQQQAIEAAVENGELQVGYDKEGNQWIAKAGEAGRASLQFGPNQKWIHRYSLIQEELDKLGLIHTNPELDALMRTFGVRNLNDKTVAEQEAFLEELASYLPAGSDVAWQLPTKKPFQPKHPMAPINVGAGIPVAGESTVVEAGREPAGHGGDRAKNLKGIADEIDSLTGPKSDPTAVFKTPELHKLKGYAEQLRIIANELGSGHLKGIADEIDSLTSGGRAIWRLPELHKLKGYVDQLRRGGF
jgi:hypothetical protein